MLLYNPVGKGTYWRAVQLARSVAERGHTVTVLATSRTRRVRFDTRADVCHGVTLVESPDMLWGPLRTGWDAWNLLARIFWARGKQFDLVHVFESRPNAILPGLYWQRRGVPLILDWCDWFGRGGSVEERPSRWVRMMLGPVETFFEEHYRARADGTTVINSQLRQRAIDLGVPEATIYDLPNGCDVDTLRPLSRTDTRRRLGWPDEELLIGYVGAIFQRDAMLMAQAFDRIVEVEPRARLLLVGCNVAVEKLVAAPHAVRRIASVDFSQINPYLAACDICWLPLCDSVANRGRYPLKLGDYMAVGRAVVATDVGDAARVIQRGGFGMLAPDRADELAQQVLRLLHDETLRESMGQRARQLAETKFTWAQVGAGLECYYQQVLAEVPSEVTDMRGLR